MGGHRRTSELDSLGLASQTWSCGCWASSPERPRVRVDKGSHHPAGCPSDWLHIPFLKLLFSPKTESSVRHQAKSVGWEAGNVGGINQASVFTSLFAASFSLVS